MAWTREQLEAIEKEGSNIIVSAGAGSGKTAVLTNRVLRKLKAHVDIDSLLILTFTKAAASEMKERIRKSIEKEPSLINQLEKIDSAYITTFDSFALSVVKKYYYLLGIPMNIAITDASIMSLAKKKFMDEAFDELYEENEDYFRKFITDFCLKDDKDLKKSIINLNEKLSLRYDKDDYLSSYIDENFNDDKITLDVTKYVSFLKKKIEIINNLVIELSYLVDSSYMSKVSSVMEPLFSSKEYIDIKNNALLELPRLPSGSSDDVKKKKELITKELKNLRALTTYETEEYIKKDIYSTLKYAKSIVKVIQVFDKKLNAYKEKNNMYEFTDIAILAINLIENNSDVKQELTSKFNEILLDEYQDTSDLQEKFISCISNNNVYMVGDIKQSIYRFRNANPYIFKNKYDAYSLSNGGIKIDLMKNFRSRREVLENINEIFNHIMDDKIGGAEYQNGHQMIFGNTTYEENGKTDNNYNFEFYNYTYDKNGKFKREEIEIFLIAKDIKEKVNSNYQVYDKDKGILRNITYNDFVILMDRSKNFSLYKKIFEYLGIPIVIYQDESIQNGYDMDIIKNILKLLVKEKKHEYDTEFKYAFMSVARSYLSSYSDQEIFNAITTNDYHPLSFMDTVSLLSANIDLMENKELIFEILKKFNFYEKIITVGNVEESLVRYEYLTNMASNLSNLGYDIYDMIDYFENVKEQSLDIKYSLNTDSGNAVKIMTIHKSKGLEYHICYFSGLYEHFNTLEVKERFTYDNSYGIILPVCKDGIRTTIYKEMYKEKYINEEISEKIRLFYVALTRAKEKMIFVCDTNDILCDTKEKQIIDDYTRSHYTSFLDMINSIKQYLEPYIKVIDIESLNLTKNYNFIKDVDYKKMIKKSSNNFIVNENKIEVSDIVNKHFSKNSYNLITRKQKKNMYFGTNLHQVFEQIDFLNPDYSHLGEFYKQKLQAFLTTPLFNDNIINIYKEYEFMYIENDIEMHGIMDLILQYNDHYAIVDYKTKLIDDDQYKKQLVGYKTYLQKVTSMNIDIYIYSILDEDLKKL